MKNQRGLRGAYRLFGVQLALTLLTMVLFGIKYGTQGMLSSMVGGLTSIVPNFCFAQMLFRDARASASKQTMRRVYRGEALKLVLSIVFFALAFGCLNIIPMVFFVVYFVVQLMCWIAPWIFMTGHTRRH